MLFFSDNSGHYQVNVLRAVEAALQKAAELVVQCGAKIVNASSCTEPASYAREYGIFNDIEFPQPHSYVVSSCSGAHPSDSAVLQCVDIWYKSHEPTPFTQPPAGHRGHSDELNFVMTSLFVGICAAIIAGACYGARKGNGALKEKTALVDNLDAEQAYLLLIAEKSEHAPPPSYHTLSLAR